VPSSYFIRVKSIWPSVMWRDRWSRGLARLGVLEAEHLLVEVAGALHVVDLEGDVHDAIHGCVLMRSSDTFIIGRPKREDGPRPALRIARSRAAAISA
jgi:hypothetical protein